ncbi:MAG TPA: hypothetical protein VIL99_09795, partial [Ignavibacteria bacterium]
MAKHLSRWLYLNKSGPPITNFIKQFSQNIVLTTMIDLFLDMNLARGFSRKSEILTSSVAVNATTIRIVLHSPLLLLLLLLFCYEKYFEKDSFSCLFAGFNLQGICP